MLCKLLMSGTVILMLMAVLINATSTDDKDSPRDSRVRYAPPSNAEHHDDDHHDHQDGGNNEDGRQSGRMHDSKYDHESFLGRDQSSKVDKLSEDAAKKKLAELFAKIDKNNDRKISEAEMQAWLSETATQERVKDVAARFNSIKVAVSAKDMNSSLSFEEWKRAMKHEIIGDGPADTKTQATFDVQLARDLARWVKADANGDQKIDKNEFADFLFAELSPRMKDVVVAETLSVSDLNKDGKIDIAEYMHELYPEYEKEKQEGKKMPVWVVKEEEHFNMSLDLNKDGFLDAEEVYKWIVPDDIDRSKKETKHLFEVADDDKDKLLSMDEVMKNWQTFVGHRVTHFGEFAPRSHDEL